MGLPSCGCEAGSGTDLGFRLAQSHDGEFVLRFQSVALPVNEAYLAHLAGETGFTVAPGEEREVDPAWAREAIGQALEELDREISSAKCDRWRLLCYRVIAEAAVARGANASCKADPPDGMVQVA